MGTRIVVGVDGSEPSQQAVRWAAHEAGARNARLVLVHAFDTERLRTSAGAQMWIDEVEASIIKRDRFDSSREHSPLTEATGSKVVDTTGMTIDEVVDHILELLEAAR